MIDSRPATNARSSSRRRIAGSLAGVHPLTGVSVLLLGVGFAGIFWRYATFDWSHHAVGAYTHAYLAAPVWVWLMVRAARRTATPPWTRPISSHALLLLGCGLTLKLVGELQGYEVLRGLAIIPVLTGLLLAIYPPRELRPFVFPLAYLLVIVPLPTFLLDELTVPLRLWHGGLAAAALDALGIAARAEGYRLLIEPSGALGVRQLFISQGCSGISSLMALLALGGLYVHLTRLETVHKSVLYIAVPLLALSANWLRIMATAWIAHRWGTDAAESFFHGAAGVLSFLLALLLLVGLAQLRFQKAVN